MGIAKADRKLMREINSMQVLQQIRAHGPISRPELADATGLGLSTISNIVTALLDSNLIHEVGEGDSSGGRRPGLLDIYGAARHAFGVKIGPGTVWISAFDLRARQIATEELMFALGDSSEKLFVQIAEIIDGMRRRLRLAKRTILGVGVSSSGLIDASSGTCVYSPILGWDNVAIRDSLAALIKLDVMVENDVNAFAYGALMHEENAGARNLICITTGPGVGAGIILDRHLYRGSQGGAGEFGHMSIDRFGPQCSCGRRGCLEVLASDQYLLARARQILQSSGTPALQGLAYDNKLSPKSILRAAESGDEIALGLYRELGENLGQGVANLVNLFNPDKIIIGGEGAAASQYFLESLQKTAIQCAFPHLADDLAISIDDGSEDVWLQGVAMLVIEKFFEIPLSA